ADVLPLLVSGQVQPVVEGGLGGRQGEGHSLGSGDEADDGGGESEGVGQAIQGEVASRPVSHVVADRFGDVVHGLVGVLDGVGHGGDAGLGRVDDPDEEAVVNGVGGGGVDGGR